MEHKIVLGGEAFLPFARSRIRALKALGNPYADQSFEVDGVSIKVRIEPGHEYIRIEGGTTDLKMDSGIVDVGFTGLDDYRKYFPGRLIKPTPIVVYDAGFTVASNRIDSIYTAASGENSSPTLTYTTPWFTKPLPTDGNGVKIKTSAGQLSGEIELAANLIKGYVRRDGVAKSFEPQRILNSNTPPAKVPNPADDALVSKKKASDRCPPSMFTGRARLYAQAMFGQYLYRKDTPPGVVNSFPGLSEKSGSPPTLLLQIHKDSDTARADKFAKMVAEELAAATLIGMHLVYQNPYKVTLNINSGVYLDQMLGKHWLINPTRGKLIIMPLVSSAAGEKLRKWLKPSSPLSTEDRAHLEAYILSACRPHVELRVVVSVSNIEPYSMGYGWHWNWSGTVADVVKHEYSARSDGSSTATHYRLTTTSAYDAESKSTSWSASISVVEGPKDWMTWRSICCFTHPNWLDRSSTISEDHIPVYWSEKGPWQVNPYIVGYASDVPLYAFYKGDELQLFRYKTVVDVSDKREVTFTSGYAQWLYPGETPPNLAYSLSYMTEGANGGSMQDTVAVYTAYTHSITGPGIGVAVRHNYIKDGIESAISGKTFIGWTPSDGALGDPELWEYISQFILPSYEQRYVGFPSGPPLADFPLDGWTLNAQAIVAAPIRIGPLQNGIWGYTSSSSHIREYPTGVAGAMIPFYDAEAFYVLQDTQYEVHHSDETLVTGGTAFMSGKQQYADVLGNISGEFTYTRWNTPAGGGTVSTADPRVVVSNHEVKLNVSVGGTVLSSNLVPGSAMAMFEDSSDFIGDTFKTLSSAGIGKLAFGLVKQNWPTETMARPVIVGWV